MTTIMLLGGYGQTGQALAPLLLDETSCDLVLAGRHPEKGQVLAGSLNARGATARVQVRYADAADPASLVAALVGVDLVVVVASTAVYCENVARAALVAGVDYLDIQYATAKLAVLRRLAPEIDAAGRCFITDGGFHPGVPAALVRYGASRFDHLERAAVASAISVDWASYQLGRETKEEFAQEFMGYEARVFRDGRWQDCNALAMMTPAFVSFRPPFGRRACVPMTLAEMEALPQMFSSLRETGFAIAGFNPISDWVVMPVVIAGLKVAPRHLLAPMARLLFWSLARFAGPPFGVALRLEAAGTTSGRPHNLTVNLFHENGYAFTAIPVAACIRQWLDGRARRPGLHFQAHVVEPEAFLRDMARLGATVTVDESTTPDIDLARFAREGS